MATAVFGAAQEPALAIFNGRNLENWDGDKRFWSVADGTIRGETSLERMPATNTFLIWRGSVLKDFELKLKFRLRNGNSGVQYRSHDLGKMERLRLSGRITHNGPQQPASFASAAANLSRLIGESVETLSGHFRYKSSVQFAGKKIWWPAPGRRIGTTIGSSPGEIILNSISPASRPWT